MRGRLSINYDSAIKKFAFRTFDKQDILRAIRNDNPSLSDNAVNKALSRLAAQGLIKRIANGLYVASDTQKADYFSYSRSETTQSIELLLKNKFPLIDFLVFDKTQLNEFLNHQIAKNTVFVETEEMLLENVFEALREQFPSVLFSPSPDGLARYGDENSIVVGALPCRYPKNKKRKHEFSIEKLIVDLFANKLLNEFLSNADYPAALETIFSVYHVNESALFSYAKYRRVVDVLETMIKEQTEIKLYTR